MNHMFLKNVKYILSAPSKKYWISEDRKEICIESEEDEWLEDEALNNEESANETALSEETDALEATEENADNQ